MAAADGLQARAVLAPPYDGIRLWWLPLPAGGRPQHRQRVYRWLQQQLPQQLDAAVEAVRRPGEAPRLLCRGQTLGLSLAYAGNAALVAVGPQAALGVDLVWHGDIGDDLHAVAAEFLPPALGRWLARLPAERRQAGFGQCWAQFEAALKTAGLPLARHAELAPALWQRAVPVLGLPPGYYAALSVSTPFSD